MTFEELVDQAIAMLERRGRVTYRVLKRQFQLEGTVNQIMGNGIMALFGAPIAHEDHAVRACYASLAMQEAIRRYSQVLVGSQGAYRLAGALPCRYRFARWGGLSRARRGVSEAS